MTLCWKERSITGDLPSARGGHSFSAVRQDAAGSTKLVLIGGSDAFGVASSEAFVVTPCPGGSGIWRANRVADQSPAGASMPPRMGHSAVTIAGGGESDARSFHDSILIFGGSVSLPEPKVFNDLWILQLRQGTDPRRFPGSTAAQHPEDYLLTEGRWVSLQGMTVGADAPTPRHAHGSCLLASPGSRGRMMVIGGAGESGVVLADAFVLDLDGFVWSRIATHPLLGREMLSAVAAASSDQRQTIVVSGGRDGSGALVASTVALVVAPAGHASKHSSQAEVCEMDMNTARQPDGRCCHSLLALSPSLLLAAGGLVADQDLFRDQLLVIDPDRNVSVGLPLRRVDNKGTELMLGFGQSAASWRDAHGKDRHCIFSGIFPNATSHSNSLYELVSI